MTTVCHKRTYLDKASADIALEQRIALSPHKSFKGMHSYQCPRCHLWHHGHPWKSRRQNGNGSV
jgi:hypothetical protein